MIVPFLVVWFVCGLGTAILAAAIPWSRGAVAVGVVAFIAGAWWAQQPFAPTAAVVSLAAGLMAAWQVVRDERRPYAAAMAGLLAGVWTSALMQQQLPMPAAIGAAVLLPALSAYLRAHRPAFAPPGLREEALLILAIVGVAAAALPGIADGWHAAGSLSVQGSQQQAASAGEAAMPAWTMAVASVALISGGLFSIWSRR